MGGVLQSGLYAVAIDSRMYRWTNTLVLYPVNFISMLSKLLGD